MFLANGKNQASSEVGIGITKGKLLEELLVEADELMAIFTTIGRKSK
jgi:hypothetical protein